MSSSEAEFYALSEAVKEGLFVQNLLEGMNKKVQRPIIARCDNIGAIFMANNRSATTRTKHIDLRKYFINDMVETGELKVDFVKSEDNMTDIWTKNVSATLFEKHTEGLVTESIEEKKTT